MESGLLHRTAFPHAYLLPHNKPFSLPGDNARCQLGLPWLTHATAEPCLLRGGPAGWSALSFGEAHTAGLGSDGGLWTWGRNARGQCGHGDEEAPYYQQPLKVYVDPKEATQPAATAAATSDVQMGIEFKCGRQQSA